jgi:hypothetical protein
MVTNRTGSSTLTLYYIILVYVQTPMVVMRMQAGILKCVIASLMLLILIAPTQMTNQVSEGNKILPASRNSLIENSNSVPEGACLIDTGISKDAYSLSDIPGTPQTATGILDSVIVEQQGVIGTDTVSARTDIKTNTNNSLEIDTLHDWVASEANVTINNLKRLYVVNGTLDEGIPGVNVNPTGTVSYYPFGWTSDSYATVVGTIQKSAFVQGLNPFAMLENEGNLLGTGANTRFQHASETRITWSQVIDNRPYSEDFILSLDFMYINGPLDSALGDAISLEVWIDGTRYWNQSLPQLVSKDIWQSSGVVNINIPGAPDTFEFDVRLAINDDLLLYPTEYGFIDSNYLTVHIDNIVFTGNIPPTPEQVDLLFNVGSVSELVTGSSGIGTATILNSSYWNTPILLVSFDSNTSISFDYEVRLLNHRFTESSWTSDILKIGVAYTIESGISGTLDLYTYLGASGIYDDQELKIFHPGDWENFTVQDPFLSDVSPSCTFGIGVLIIHESVLDRLGWWKITCDAPNYAQSAIVERYDSGIPSWVNETVFHSTEMARLSVSLGTDTETPFLSEPINFTWILSNYSTWYESSHIGGMIGSTSSPSVTFGPVNTTAGIWCVKYHWSNGTELAYDCETFELHHSAVLESVYTDTVETILGQPVSVYLRFRDSENGLYILNNGATVVGNWSGGDVAFLPDLVKNWWQADFDTGGLNPGDYTIRIVSAAPYFETTPLVITVKVQSLTNLAAPSGPLTPLIYGRQYSYDFFYSMSHNGTGIEGAFVNLTEDGAQWASILESGDGHYELSILPLAIGDFSIRLAFSKVGYETETHVVSFLTDPVPIEIGSISSLVGLEQTPFDIDVHIVESDTGNPVTGANVTLGIYRPGGVLYLSDVMLETTPGTYTLTIMMPISDSGTYTVRILVEKDYHLMTQSFSTALVPTFDSNARLFQTLLRYSWQIGIVAIVVGAVVVGQRARSRRNKRKHLTAVEIKHRFSDANNILGFLVLHKISGVPIYSKIFKGGFEEGMLSAFISAIMHFRSSFENNDESDEYKVIPISEVIRVVPTEHLVCAFITVTSPSTEQEAKMRSYSRAIGMMFDESFAEVGPEVIDTKISNTFEWMFDDFMDGILIRRYQVGEKKFPKPLRFIEKAIPLEEKDGSFRIHRLIRLLTSSGTPEDEVYIRMLKAIEDEYILPIRPHRFNSETSD